MCLVLRYAARGLEGKGREGEGNGKKGETTLTSPLACACIISNSGVSSITAASRRELRAS